MQAPSSDESRCGHPRHDTDTTSRWRWRLWNGKGHTASCMRARWHERRQLHRRCCSSCTPGRQASFTAVLGLSRWILASSGSVPPVCLIRPCKAPHRGCAALDSLKLPSRRHAGSRTAMCAAVQRRDCTAGTANSPASRRLERPRCAPAAPASAAARALRAPDSGRFGVPRRHACRPDSPALPQPSPEM